MAKLPANRYSSAAEMLEALNAYVENPAIVFNYTYLPEEVPEKVVTPSMSQKREAGTVRGSAKNTRKKGKKRSSAFLPVLFGITVAFALACAALCWSILNDSSNLMNQKADVVLLDEPTAFLDVDSRAAVLSTIDTMSPEISVIFSSHDIYEASRHCTRIFGIARDAGESKFIDSGANASEAERRAVLSECFRSAASVHATSWL